MGLWQDLGVSSGTAIIVLIALYFIIKWAVKNGVKEAYKDITGKKTSEDIELEKITKEAETRHADAFFPDIPSKKE